MLSLAISVAISAAIMRAVSTLNEGRNKPEYFTRNRKMPFDKLMRFLLSMHKTSTQSALHNFFENKGITMSQQALSKARSKINHTPFLKLLPVSEMNFMMPNIMMSFINFTENFF